MYLPCQLAIGLSTDLSLSLSLSAGDDTGSRRRHGRQATTRISDIKVVHKQPIPELHVLKFEKPFNLKRDLEGVAFQRIRSRSKIKECD